MCPWISSLAGGLANSGRFIGERNVTASKEKGGEMTIQMTALAALLLSVPVLADDVSDRAKLLGSWQRQDDSGKETTVWVLEMKGMALHVSESLGDQKISEFECVPKGAECEGTDEGKKAKVTMYYDGPGLVQLVTKGSDVTRRRFTATGQPDMMEIEVMPFVGAGKAESMHLKRIKISAGSR
jgi:hypothetical protein